MDEKCGKALYAAAIVVEDEQLRRVKLALTLKEAWDILVAALAKQNKWKLQPLENELYSISQQNLTVNQYFSKVKSLCDISFDDFDWCFKNLQTTSKCRLLN